MEASEFAAPRAEPNTFALFRRCFTLGQSADLTLHIAAETYYQLFVNGRFVGRGAPLSQPWFHYYDDYRLEGLLRPGRNCIAVLVYFVGNARDTRGGLLVEATGRDGQLVVGTDAEWRALRATAWRQDAYCVRSNQAAPYQEHFDARAMPQGWAEPDFDDSRWPHAAVLGTALERGRVPWTRLVPRDIPHLRHESAHPGAARKPREPLPPRGHDSPTVQHESPRPRLRRCLRPVRRPRLRQGHHRANRDRSRGPRRGDPGHRLRRTPH